MVVDSSLSGSDLQLFMFVLSLSEAVLREHII